MVKNKGETSQKTRGFKHNKDMKNNKMELKNQKLERTHTKKRENEKNTERDR